VLVISSMSASFPAWSGGWYFKRLVCRFDEK